MTIETLAAKYKLRTKNDEGELIIPAKLGHLFLYSEEDNLIGAMFNPPNISRGWSVRREQFRAAGATILQNGDTEGTVTFPADRADLVKLAVKLLKAARKRSVSPETRAKRLETLAKARSVKKSIGKTRSKAS